MFRRNLRTIFCLFLVSVLLGVSASVVYAAVKSNWKNYGPINTYSYRNQASAGINNWNEVYASTWVENTDSENVPAGYMGNKARLYSSSGSLLEQSVWDYNDDPCGGFSQIAPTRSQSGTYYSKGQTKAYTGNGYNTYDTYQSPNIQKS